MPLPSALLILPACVVLAQPAPVSVDAVRWAAATGLPEGVCQAVAGWVAQAEALRTEGKVPASFVVRAEGVAQAGLAKGDDLDRLAPGTAALPAWTAPLPKLEAADLSGFKGLLKALGPDPALDVLAARVDALLAKGKSTVVRAAFDRFQRAQARLPLRNTRTLGWLLADSLEVEELAAMKELTRKFKAADYLPALTRYARLTTPDLGPALQVGWVEASDGQEPERPTSCLLLSESALARTDLPEALRGLANLVQGRLGEGVTLQQTQAEIKQGKEVIRQLDEKNRQLREVDQYMTTFVAITTQMPNLIMLHINGDNSKQEQIDRLIDEFRTMIETYQILPEPRKKQFGVNFPAAIRSVNTLIAQYLAIRDARAKQK